MTIPDIFSLNCCGIRYARDGGKIIVEANRKLYRGDIGAAYKEGPSLIVKAWARTEDAGQPFCLVEYDTRGQGDSLGVYHDRPQNSILTGAPDKITFYTRHDGIVF